MPYIEAPWPDEFVERLNENQHNGKYPPYLCDKCQDEMVATKEGWICPSCDYKQNWMIT